MSPSKLPTVVIGKISKHKAEATNLKCELVNLESTEHSDERLVPLLCVHPGWQEFTKPLEGGHQKHPVPAKWFQCVALILGELLKWDLVNKVASHSMGCAVGAEFLPCVFANERIFVNVCEHLNR